MVKTFPNGGVIRRRYVISGTVQGVGFRYWTVREAGRFAVVGYVKNLPGGRVEAVVQGPARDVEAFEAELRQGPPYANVDEVYVFDEPAGSDFQSFSVAF